MCASITTIHIQYIWIKQVRNVLRLRQDLEKKAMILVFYTSSSRHGCNTDKVHFLCLLPVLPECCCEMRDTVQRRRLLKGQSFKCCFFFFFFPHVGQWILQDMWTAHSTAHLFLFLRLRTCSAALVAISNTSRTPSLVLAEHSKYPKALIRLDMSRPSSVFTGSCVVQIREVLLEYFQNSYYYSTNTGLNLHVLYCRWSVQIYEINVYIIVMN